MAGTLYRDLMAILSTAGCVFVRQAAGSHEIWFSPISNQRFSIPANISSRKLANNILKQAGLPKAF
jgi:predicted RNA binding protein YcfA (HicA-like mRNA interferase family)